MSFSTINIPVTRSILSVDTRQGANKILYLPTASTMAGRYISIKDYYGTCSSSSFSISTTGFDRIDVYNSTIQVSTSFQNFSFLSDGLTNWETLANQTGPTPVTFLPSNISNPDIWFDASYWPNLRYDKANSNVIGWSNRGSIAISADSNGGYTTPKVLQSSQNGLNVVTYAAGKVNLITPTMSLPDSEKTLFAVFRQTDFIRAGSIILFLQANNGGNFGDFSFLVGYSSADSNLVATVNGGYCFPMYGYVSSEIINTYTMLSFVTTKTDNGNQGIWQNGSLVTNVFSCPSDNNSSSYNYSVGGTTGTDNTSPFHYAESIIYTSALTVSDRQRVEGYLSWKWGLRHLLPADHPYKNAAP